MKLKELKESTFLSDRNLIEDWCIKMEITDYYIRSDGTVDALGDVDISKRDIVELPIKFGRVEGHFNISENPLKTLKGCPEIVEATFYCGGTSITSLEFAPTFVNGGVSIAGTKIETLQDIDKFFPEIRGAFWTGALGWRHSTGIKSHCLGLLKIKGLTNVKCHPDSPQAPAFAIIAKYLGRPNDLFDCQAELIDAGLDEYAQL